jgi:hypothetical protein
MAFPVSSIQILLLLFKKNWGIGKLCNHGGTNGHFTTIPYEI